MKKINRSVRAHHCAFFRTHKILLAAAAAASVALHPPFASASGPEQWIGGNSSDWNTNTNWSPIGVPGPGDTANVTSLLGVTQNIAYDYGGLTLTLGTLNLNLVNGTSPSSEILTISTAKTLSANTENIGGFSGSPSGNSGGGGNGTLTQSAGSNVVGVGGLYLGFNGADQGFYNLSGTGVLSADQEEIGVSGTGTFTQTGGTHTVTAVNVTNPAALIVGYSGTGTYTQSAGVLTTPGDEFVGYVGTGNFSQSGGTNTANGTAGLVVAFSGLLGSYTLSNTAVLSVSGLTIGNGDVGTFTQTGGTNTVGTLGMVVGVFASGTYTMSGNSTLTAPQENIGGTKGSIQAVGNFTQTAGSNTINTSGLFLGFNSKDQGAYTLNGGMLSVNAGTETIGVSGTGTFTQTTGSNTLSPFTDQHNLMFLGKNVGSVGTYTLSGTGSVSAFEEEIGVSGAGVFTQSAGSNTLFSNLSIDLGVNAGSTGTYNLSNTGTISASLIEYVGDQGTGIFNQSGGTNNTDDGILNIANTSKSTGSYTLSSTGILTAQTENVGLNGTGVFTQTGGSNSVGQGLNVGENAGSTGTYTLSSTGTLTAVQEFIGFSGTGFFNQDGGTNTLPEDATLNIAANSGSSGTFVIIGGTTSAPDVNVGGNDPASAGGKGFLTVSQSGVLNATNQLQAFPTAGTIINLTGGTINTGTLNLNGNPSKFNWTSGTLGLTQSVTFDPSAANNTTGAAFGASLTLGANEVLNVTGTEGLGGGASFTLTVRGGVNNILGGNDLNITPSGNSSSALSLTGGAVSVSGNAYVGGSSSGPASTGAGTLTVSGPGVLNVTGTLVAYNAGTTTVNLTGGTINTSALNLNGTPSRLNWTSGTLGLTQGVTFDPSAGSTSTGAAFGSSLTLGANQVLVVTGLESIGGGAPFTFTNSGGANTVTGSGGALLVGSSTGSTGTYILSNNGSISANGEAVGLQGTGFYTQTSGTNTDAGGLEIGIVQSGSGTFTLSGGTTTVVGDVLVGALNSSAPAPGNLTVNDTGTLSVTGTLAASNGATINLSGGTINTSALNFNGTPSRFNWTSGTLGLTQSVTFDPSQSGTSTSAAFGTALTVGPNQALNVTGVEFIGGGAPFALTVSGGSNTITGSGTLILGNNAGATGTFNLSSTGTLTALDQQVGANGMGVFNQSGGTNTITGNSELDIAADPSTSTGAYLLSGGTASVGGGVFVGGTSVHAGGKGVLTVSGTGQLTVGGTLQIFNGSVVNLNQGTSTVGALNIPTGGQLNVNANLLIKYGSTANDPVATIRSELAAAYKAHYTGTALAITSTTAGAKPAAFAVGYVDTTSTDQLKVALTVPGDTNLSGATDFTDLTTVAQFFGQSIAKGNNIGWQTGDVNYDGNVDFSDLTIVAQFFGDSLTKAEAASLTVGFVAQYNLALEEVGGGTSSVPEPASLAFLTLIGVGILIRRRKAMRLC